MKNNTGFMLQKLVELTSNHELQRLEISLIKTMLEVLPARRLLLIKMDNDAQFKKFLIMDEEYNKMQSLHPGEVKDWLPIEELQTCVLGNAGPCNMNSVGGGILCIFPILDIKSYNLCLVFETDHEFQYQEQLLIQSFLQVYRNFCVLMMDAQLDELTGLYNRKTFDDIIQQVINDKIQPSMFYEDFLSQSSSEQSQGLTDKMMFTWIAVLDIDDFKRINDTYGHLFGDEVIILISRLMQNTFREEGLVYRFGGEEFVIITYQTDIEGISMVLERLRSKIAEHDFPQIGRVTVSIGATSVQLGNHIPSILDQADQAMYYAKNHGKNRVCIYDQLINDGEIKPVQIHTGDIEYF